MLLRSSQIDPIRILTGAKGMEPVSKRFVYFYFMKDNAELIRQIAPSHAAYWKAQGLGQYMGGPFRDGTGGLISFEAASLNRALELVEDDPFVLHGLLEEKWVREWVPE
jgi:uncharacterized protein